MNKKHAEYRLQNSSELVKLWIIIAVNGVESILHFWLDLIYLIKDPEFCKDLIGNMWADASLWFFFRFVSLNLWVIVTFYVFSARKVYKTHRMQEESYFIDAEDRSFVNHENKAMFSSSLQDLDAQDYSSSSMIHYNPMMLSKAVRLIIYLSLYKSLNALCIESLEQDGIYKSKH